VFWGAASPFFLLLFWDDLGSNWFRGLGILVQLRLRMTGLVLRFVDINSRLRRLDTGPVAIKSFSCACVQLVLAESIRND
jgi:hypothetical protein